MQQETVQNASQSPTAHILDVTSAALIQFRATLQNEAGAIGIRVGVSGGGCAGLQYEMKPCKEELPGDFIQVVDHDVKLYIHPVAAAYLKGTQIDFSDAMMDGGFKFINPNATNACGCGQSFGV